VLAPTAVGGYDFLNPPWAARVFAAFPLLPLSGPYILSLA